MFGSSVSFPVAANWSFLLIASGSQNYLSLQKTCGFSYCSTTFHAGVHEQGTLSGCCFFFSNLFTLLKPNAGVQPVLDLKTYPIYTLSHFLAINAVCFWQWAISITNLSPFTFPWPLGLHQYTWPSASFALPPRDIGGLPGRCLTTYQYTVQSLQRCGWILNLWKSLLELIPGLILHRALPRSFWTSYSLFLCPHPSIPGLIFLFALLYEGFGSYVLSRPSSFTPECFISFWPCGTNCLDPWTTPCFCFCKARLSGVVHFQPDAWVRETSPTKKMEGSPNVCHPVGLVRSTGWPLCVQGTQSSEEACLHIKFPTATMGD